MNAVPTVNASKQSASLHSRPTRQYCTTVVLRRSMALRVQRLFSTLRALRHDSQGLPKRGEPPTMPRRSLPPKRGIPNVKKVIAVASGKGGVGKSTVAGLSSIHSIHST